MRFELFGMESKWYKLRFDWHIVRRLWDYGCFRQRPYFIEYTRSHPNSEVKRWKARSVLGWGTAREALRVLLAFCFIIKFRMIFYFLTKTKTKGRTALSTHVACDTIFRISLFVSFFFATSITYYDQWNACTAALIVLRKCTCFYVRFARND